MYNDKTFHEALWQKFVDRLNKFIILKEKVGKQMLCMWTFGEQIELTNKGNLWKNQFICKQKCKRRVVVRKKTNFQYQIEY